MDTSCYRPLCSALPSHHTFLLLALISALGFSSTPKGNRPYTEGGRTCGEIRYVPHSQFVSQFWRTLLLDSEHLIKVNRLEGRDDTTWIFICTWCKARTSLPA